MGDTVTRKVEWRENNGYAFLDVAITLPSSELRRGQYLLGAEARKWGKARGVRMALITGGGTYGLDVSEVRAKYVIRTWP